MRDEVTEPQPDPHAEPDPRLPSGPWVGFWLQRRIAGRQWMRGLHLRFKDGRVEGGGSDCVGAFTLDGQYALTPCTVKLFKRYVGKHTVLYEGQNEDDGRWLWGVWTLHESTGVDRGGFHMWPRWREDPTQRRAGAAREIEVVEEVAAPV